MNRHERRAAEKLIRSGNQKNLSGLLNSAIQAHQSGRLEEAESVYRLVLHALPQQPDACHYLGVLLHQRGHSEEGIDYILRALSENPHYVDAQNNLGNVYKETGDAAKAEQAYRKVLAWVPNHFEALNNLGIVLGDLEAFDEAEQCLLQAIRLQPNRADFLQNLGSAYFKQRDYPKSAEAFRKSITLKPNEAEAYRILWRTLYIAKEFDEAVKVLRQWLEFDPDNPIALHTYAAHLGGELMPERASDAYVKETFDNFAGSFDNVLARLDYRAPGLVVDAVGRAVGEGDGQLIVLDAGCGTGLCGPLLRPYARQLIGVDLSPKMLAKAEGRQIYEALIEAELVQYLEHNPSRFNLIVSADTLVYFGNLVPFAHAAHNALLSNGHLIFTVEKKLEGYGFSIGVHGRYCHAQDYVLNTLTEAGFQLVDIDEVHLRKETGEAVIGLLVSANLS